MIILFFVLSLLIEPSLSAQEVKPLYEIPEKLSISEKNNSKNTDFLVGSDDGLFRLTQRNNAIPLWSEGRVEQILKANLPNEKGELKDCWFFRTEKGIIFSSDLKTFELRNEGLPFLTIKEKDNTEVKLTKKIQTLKDICVNPFNNKEIVTATKDTVFYSADEGKSWTSLKSMSLATPGVKAVAIATIQDETVVFMSHPIFGLSYIYPNRKNPTWIDITSGFEMMPSLSSPDEIADILPVVRKNEDGTNYIEIYLSQTYIPRLYRFDWATKKAELIYKGKEPVDVIDGLTIIDDVLVYSTIEGFGSININTKESPGIPAKFSDWSKAFEAVPNMVNAAWIPHSRSGFNEGICLNELWLLYPGTINSKYGDIADKKKSIYVSAYQCRTQAGIDKFKKIIKDGNFNSLVIDMKDDYGLLRYDTRDPLLLEKGKVTQYAVNLDKFIEEFKKENIYLVARIVTFKDRTLSQYKNGKYAVWDSKTNVPWLGIKGYEDVVDENEVVTGKKTLYYDEHWVDPYSEEVWEYNVEVAKDLISRGFDEIQFDYIRFPTDGYNLKNATYRWKSEGMDKESALISFLSYARKNIDAPVGIDIYGANGWYRSGTRTGQDAEMLSEYVDVIAPMFYPSHFEQTFLNYPPVADRTYRIYYYGSFRNTVMARNRAVIRPWVQAFYLGVSYDKLYYDEDYIEKQYFGVRDSIDRGYMCWNNSGDYDILPPDITAESVFTGKAPEADSQYRKPAIGSKTKKINLNNDLSILDSIWNQEQDYYSNNTVFSPILQIPILKFKREE
jgi:hypothetical protein